ncbi:MAG: hypothetical protein R3A52_08125 [Polyangiales bacterium]
MLTKRALTLVFLSLLAAGCGDDVASSPDASARDVPVVVDAGTADLARSTPVRRTAARSTWSTRRPDVAADTGIDAGTDLGAIDASPADTGATDAGTDLGATDVGVDAGRFDIVGTVGGSCGTLASMLASTAPSLVDDQLVFMTGESYARMNLSPDGQRLFDTANAGGSSAESEVMSFEVLHHCEGARLLRTETEIRYQPPDDSGPNSITDILVEIAGQRVGVSVTRAWRPSPLAFGDTEVRALLVDKLNGVNRSSVRVLPEDRWVKQILHVWVANAEVAASVRRVWMSLDASLRANTIVLVTQTTGGGFLYCNPDPPLGMECPPIM